MLVFLPFLPEEGGRKEEDNASFTEKKAYPRNLREKRGRRLDYSPLLGEGRCRSLPTLEKRGTRRILVPPKKKAKKKVFSLEFVCREEKGFSYGRKKRASRPLHEKAYIYGEPGKKRGKEDFLYALGKKFQPRKEGGLPGRKCFLSEKGTQGNQPSPKTRQKKEKKGLSLLGN